MTGTELRRLRESNGLTQQRLGELMGYMGQSALVSVQRWEYGTRPIPATKLKRLSRILHVPLEALIPDEEE